MQGGATGTGTITLLAPITNTDRTLTLPDATGTMLTTATAGVPVNGPAFSAYLTSATSSTINTWVKLQFNNEVFDTASCYDPTTNYRFTPNVAGYYQVNLRFQFAASSSNAEGTGGVYKNGAIYARISGGIMSSASGYVSPAGGCLVYLNGTTDYIEAYSYASATTAILAFADSATFSAAMVRSAV